MMTSNCDRMHDTDSVLRECFTIDDVPAQFLNHNVKISDKPTEEGQLLHFWSAAAAQYNEKSCWETYSHEMCN